MNLILAAQEVKANAYRDEFKLLHGETELLHSETDDLKKKDSPSRKELQAQLEKLQAQSEKLVQRDTKHLDLKVDLAITKAKSENLKDLWTILKVVMSFGFVATIWGFTQWHRRIQIPQDELIKEQIDALRRQRLAEAKAEAQRNEERPQT